MKNYQYYSTEQLLKEVDKLFPYKKEKIDTFAFALYRYNRDLWEFQVINSWHKWIDKGLEYRFGGYEKPEWAIQAFLNYVMKNKINVKKLMKESY